MKKALAVLVLAALPLCADVIIPEDEQKPRPKPQPPPTETAATTTAAGPPSDTAPATPATATATAAPVAPAQAVSRTQPILWFSVAGIAIIILLAARRKAATHAE